MMYTIISFVALCQAQNVVVKASEATAEPIQMDAVKGSEEAPEPIPDTDSESAIEPTKDESSKPATIKLGSGPAMPCTVSAQCSETDVCDERKICIPEPGPNNIGVALSMSADDVKGTTTTKYGWRDGSQKIIVQNAYNETTTQILGIQDATGDRKVIQQWTEPTKMEDNNEPEDYPTPSDDEPEDYPTPTDGEEYPTPDDPLRTRRAVNEDDEPADAPLTEEDMKMVLMKIAEMAAAKRPVSEYALDRINQDDWVASDLKMDEGDEYERFFVVPNATRCTNENGVVPSQIEKKSTIIKQEEQITEIGNCHHICASQMGGLDICYGYSQNKRGDCEFYHEPLSTFAASGDKNAATYGVEAFEGEGCWIKGISCGGHTALNCEHCPTKNSEHPEMECNGQCIYEYEHVVDEKDGSQKVLGACRGIQETDKDLKDCGAHMAHSCTACVERYTYHCEEKYRYCNGQCNYEAGDCGMCPEEETTTAPATTSSTSSTAAPATEDIVKELGGAGTGDNIASTGFDSNAAADLLG